MGHAVNLIVLLLYTDNISPTSQMSMMGFKMVSAMTCIPVLYANKRDCKQILTNYNFVFGAVVCAVLTYMY